METESNESNADLQNVDLDQPHPSENLNTTNTPFLEPTRTTKKTDSNDSSSFLSPQAVPIRPYSPDTLSILSADEYDQLAGTSSRSQPTSNNKTPSSQPLRSIRTRLHSSWIRNKGLFYMLLAQFFGCLMNITTRLLELQGNRGAGFDPFQILFVRMFITTILASGYMYYKSTPHFPFGAPEVRSLLLARGFGGFFGVFGMYYSLLYLPLADATVITFLAPALACWACSVLIKEPFTRTEQIAALVSIGGVVLIARPTALFAGLGGGSTTAASGTGDAVAGSATNDTTTSIANGTTANMASSSSFGLTGTNGTATSHHAPVTPMQRLTAVGVALVGVLGSAVAYTTIRWIGKRAHPLISVNYFAVWCTIISTVMLIALPDTGFVLPADLKEWGYLLFLGVCGFAMQFLLAAGLSYEKSSRATNMTYSQMLFALGGDKLVFGHTPGVMSIIGSSLILGSAVVVAIQRDPSRSNGENERASEEGGNGVADEESMRRLVDDVEAGESTERLGIDEVQLRTLR